MRVDNDSLWGDDWKSMCHQFKFGSWDIKDDDDLRKCFFLHLYIVMVDPYVSSIISAWFDKKAFQTMNVQMCINQF